MLVHFSDNCYYMHCLEGTSTGSARVANNSSMQVTKRNCLPCIFFNILVTIDFHNFEAVEDEDLRVTRSPIQVMHVCAHFTAHPTKDFVHVHTNYTG